MTCTVNVAGTVGYVGNGLGEGEEMLIAIADGEDMACNDLVMIILLLQAHARANKVMTDTTHTNEPDFRFMR